jgi:hypothetical protein
VAESGFVTADAQFTNARVLKPYADFETIYQGNLHTIPIAFPGTLDDQAGQPGFAANLLKGIPIPFGSRLCAWIPVALIGGDTTFYQYSFIWRLRNVRDFRTQASRPPYHFPKQRPGAPDSNVVPAAPRVVIPASRDVVIYEQTEPATFGPGVMRVVNQSYRIGDGGQAVAPLLASGGGVTGIYQQGVLDPATAGALEAGSPIFQELWMDAMGDELMIIVTPQDDTGNWDFAGSDLPFSNIFGTGNGAHEVFPDIGIYIFTGTNP